MLEARIEKAVVVQNPKNGQLVLMGYVDYFGDMVNFQTEFDWPSLDIEGFLQDLRESIAETLDIPSCRVDLQQNLLLSLMRRQYELFHVEQKGLAH